MTEKVGRSSLNVGRLLPNGWISRQTPSANSSRTRLGLFQRSPEGVRKSGGRRRHFAERWTRPINWERNLQFEVANRSAPVFPSTPGPRPRFLQAPDRAGLGVSRAAKGRSEVASHSLERKRWFTGRRHRPLPRLFRPPDAHPGDGPAEESDRESDCRSFWRRDDHRAKRFGGAES